VEAWASLLDPTVSVEEEAATHLGLTIGSIVEFDIQGTTVSAEVSKSAKSSGGNFSTNFYNDLVPRRDCRGAVYYVGEVAGLATGEVPLQQAVVASFPNVSAIHVATCSMVSRVFSIVLSLAIRLWHYFVLLQAAWSWRALARHAIGVSTNRSF